MLNRLPYHNMCGSGHFVTFILINTYNQDNIWRRYWLSIRTSDKRNHVAQDTTI